MTLLSSLRNRMFLASAALAVVCIGIAIFIVNGQVTREADRTLEREIVTTSAQVEQLRNERAQTFMLMARLIADLPKLKAAMDTDNPPTVQAIASGYQAQLSANLILVTNKTGQVLYTAGGSPRIGIIAAHEPAVRDALAGHDAMSLLPQPNGILQIVSVPVVLDRPQREILGTLSAGFLLDDALAAQLKRITGSDLAFGMDGQILASTLPREAYPVLAERLRSQGISRVVIGGEEYEALPRPLAPPGIAEPGASGPVALILRSRTAQLQSLGAIHAGLFLTAVFAVLLATGLSFTVARTIARPLATITAVMREVAATGDLTRKIAVRHGSRWDDDDARLLATTFNTLTDSVAQFQREMSQKERLTSLGRLSTVIAHEIRNPLMIIKASLHALRQDVTPDAVHEAIRDIDEEVARLNRIVNEVLDFARPIRFDLSSVHVNTLCRESAAAAAASGPGAEIVLDLDPLVSTATTDPERLRIALINMLVNARHAIDGYGAANGNQPAVMLRTRRAGDRVQLTVADRGAGIAPADLAQIFDPYFTTKRGGTGLGLPITKNIVEGLGGSIGVSSAPGAGTEILVDLPLDSTQSRPA
jgi:signal transduction histidine kinase